MKRKEDSKLNKICHFKHVEAFNQNFIWTFLEKPFKSACWWVTEDRERKGLEV